RLVQQEQGGAQQQQTGEGGAHPPATRELSERARELLPLGPEPAEDDPGLSFQPVAPAGLESVLELAVPRRERLRRVGRQRGAQLPEFALDRPHVVEPPERLREHGAGRGATDFLREVADRDAAVAAHLPAVGLLETGQEAAERRLADAIWSDQPDPLVGDETPGEVREEALPAVGLRDSLEVDHRARCPARARGGSRRSRGPGPPAGWGTRPEPGELLASERMRASAPGRRAAGPDGRAAAERLRVEETLAPVGNPRHRVTLGSGSHGRARGSEPRPAPRPSRAGPGARGRCTAERGARPE